MELALRLSGLGFVFEFKDSGFRVRFYKRLEFGTSRLLTEGSALEANSEAQNHSKDPQPRNPKSQKCQARAIFSSRHEKTVIRLLANQATQNVRPSSSR